MSRLGLDLDRLESGQSDEMRAAQVEPVAVEVEAIRADAALVARYAKGSNTAEHRLSTVHVPALLAAVERLTRERNALDEELANARTVEEVLRADLRQRTRERDEAILSRDNWKDCAERHDAAVEHLTGERDAAEDRERALRAVVEQARARSCACGTRGCPCRRDAVADILAALSPVAPAGTAPTGSEAPRQRPSPPVAPGAGRGEGDEDDDAPVLETPEAMAVRLARSMHPSTARCATRADMAEMGIRARDEQIRRVLLAEAVSWPHTQGCAALIHAAGIVARLGKEPSR